MNKELLKEVLTTIENNRLLGVMDRRNHKIQARLDKAVKQVLEEGHLNLTYNRDRGGKVRSVLVRLDGKRIGKVNLNVTAPPIRSATGMYAELLLNRDHLQFFEGDGPVEQISYNCSNELLSIRQNLEKDLEHIHTKEDFLKSSSSGILNRLWD